MKNGELFTSIIVCISESLITKTLSNGLAVLPNDFYDRNHNLSYQLYIYPLCNTQHNVFKNLLKDVKICNLNYISLSINCTEGKVSRMDHSMIFYQDQRSISL
jgi:hypothetical protein